MDYNFNTTGIPVTEVGGQYNNISTTWYHTAINGDGYVTAIDYHTWEDFLLYLGGPYKVLSNPYILYSDDYQYIMLQCR